MEAKEGRTNTSKRETPEVGDGGDPGLGNTPVQSGPAPASPPLPVALALRHIIPISPHLEAGGVTRGFFAPSHAMDNSDKKKCTEDERKPNTSKGDSNITVKSVEMAENKVDNDKHLNSDKLASKENQQNTKKELRDQERPASYKDSEVGERESSTDKLNTSIKKTDNSPTAESRGNVTDSTSNPGTVNPAEKASSSEIKSNLDISKSTEKAKGDNAGSSKATDKPARSTPTEKNDNINVSVKADVKSSDKTDKNKPLVDKIDNEKTTDKTDIGKPSSKSSDKADDKKPSDTTGSKLSDDSDTKGKTGAVQETMDNVNNKTSDSNDTTTKSLDLSSSQETKLPDNGLTPKDIKAVLAQEEEYDGLNLNSSDATEAIPARWILAVLGCVGFMIVYGLKVNLSVAIIAMVNHTAVAALSKEHDSHHDDTYALLSDNMTGEAAMDECGNVAKKENLADGPFIWDETVQGIILASYFYGYIVTQVPGGWVAEKFSAKHVFGVGALINAICAILTPVAAQTSYIFLVIMRIIMGIAGGVTLPGMHVLIASWAPPAERSKIASTIYAGMTLGTLVCMPFSGLLAASLDWTAIFYVQGGLSLLWYILWLIFVFDSPAQHPRISRSERKYIEESLGTVVKSEKPPVPWRSVFKSMPVWAIIVAHTCNNWGWYMLLVKLPTYMRYILKFDIKANAGLSAVPFLCMWIFTMLLANLLDELRSRDKISTTFARKLATFLASMPPAVCLIGVTYVGCNTDLAVALLTLGTMFVGGMYSGFLSNHIDIAPPFAGTLMGISNTFATIPGILVPSIVGIVTHGNQTVEAWRFIFFITLGIFTIEAIFYCIFGSGELQEWAKPKPVKEEGEQQKLNDMA